LKKREKANTTPASTDLLSTRLLLRVAEYADLTGTPRPTVYALIAAGKIAGVVRIGNSIRIPVAALRELVARTNSSGPEELPSLAPDSPNAGSGGASRAARANRRER